MNEELETIVANAKNTLNVLLADNPQYFGSDELVLERLKSVLSKEEATPLPTPTDIMRCVDLTILDKSATDEAVKEVASRAAKEHSATVCVYPQHVPLVNEVMAQAGVLDVPPIAVVGFPSVSSSRATSATIAETKEAISLGAKEIDMVLPITFKENMESCFAHFTYLKSVIDVAHAQGIPVKVILETAYLTDDQIALASMVSKIAGADWVKTSTGFADIDKFALGRMPEEKGATPRSVAIMRACVGNTTTNALGVNKPMGVKASGGVRNKEQALAVLNAGADRIGASSGINLEDKPTSKPGAGY